MEEEARRDGREERVVRRARRREREEVGGSETVDVVGLAEEAAEGAAGLGVPGAGAGVEGPSAWAGRSGRRGGATALERTNWDSERGLKGEAEVRVERRRSRED